MTEPIRLWIRANRKQPAGDSTDDHLGYRLGPCALLERLGPDRVNGGSGKLLKGIAHMRSAPTPRYSSKATLLGLCAVAAGTAAVLAPTAAYATDGAPTSFASAQIGPAGGSVSGFGITVTLAKGAVASNRRIILSSSPSSQDVTPPKGEKALVTFGLQECKTDYTGCTSVFGNFPTSPAGTENVNGKTATFTAFQKLSTIPNSYGNTTFGSMSVKLVTIKTVTPGTDVFIYNPNPTTTAAAYPKRLPSTSANGVNTFKTFMPIAWVIASHTTAGPATTGAASTSSTTVPTQVNAGTGGQAASVSSSTVTRDAELAALAAGLLIAGSTGFRSVRRRATR